MATQHHLSDAERVERRQRDPERLQRAAEQLLSSEGWRRCVRARSSNGLARYSLTNQLLVALLSDGRATFVAGFKQWLALGYCVKRGSRAIRIMAPMPVKARDRDSGEGEGERRDDHVQERAGVLSRAGGAALRRRADAA